MLLLLLHSIDQSKSPFTATFVGGEGGNDIPLIVRMVTTMRRRKVDEVQSHLRAGSIGMLLMDWI